MRAAALAAAAGLGLAVACGGGPAPAERPDVFLISLDTVRRDAIGVYRPDRPSPTPEIDRFAASAVRFDRAWAPVPFTLPSHMSMLTGLHSEVHRVATRDSVLDESIPTLPELAAGAGYHGIGLVSNIWMKGHFGFARGFDHYQRLEVGLTYAERINDRLFELLDRRPAEDRRPLFVLLHYIDAHSDYDTEGVNLLPYSAAPEQLAELGVDPLSREFCDSAGNCATKFLTAANTDRRPLDPASIARLEALYTAGVRLLDRRIGELLRGLEARGRLADSLVVLTSDHGEEFREHGRFVHAQPYAECVAVPLLVRFPGGAHGGQAVEAPVELADLMPSILGAMGIAVPEHVPARDVFSAVAEGRSLSPVTVLSADKNRHRRFALRDATHTFIRDAETGRRELYDRVADPGEQRDLADSEPELAARLEALLDEALRAQRDLAERLGVTASGGAGDVLSEDEAEQLKAIGYLD
ncbi:MAG: sulfatase-like hydrolase/transferase [Thermoanaerobaculales bacterium]|nr:sulfatase-like hydrolase/transferase [Thermoanaerobaculales bacterium]